jgi:hypothetical protein
MRVTSECACPNLVLTTILVVHDAQGAQHVLCCCFTNIGSSSCCIVPTCHAVKHVTHIMQQASAAYSGCWQHYQIPILLRLRPAPPVQPVSLRLQFLLLFQCHCGSLR